MRDPSYIASLQEPKGKAITVHAISYGNNWIPQIVYGLETCFFEMGKETISHKKGPTIRVGPSIFLDLSKINICAFWPPSLVGTASGI